MKRKKRRRPVSRFDDTRMKSTLAHPVVNDSLESVLELLPHPVTLEDVNDAEEEKEPLSLVISGGNSAGSESIQGED